MVRRHQSSHLDLRHLRIRPSRHPSNYVTNKKSLNGLDDKRILEENSPKTFAHGHKDKKDRFTLYD